MAIRTIALSRTYAQHGDVEKRVTENRTLVAQLCGKVDHVRFVVWENVSFPDADCGHTYDALIAAFAGDDFVSIRKGGSDPFVGVLNSQLPEISDEGYDWLLVISATSGHMVTSRVVDTVHQAISEHGIDAIAIVPPDVPSVGQGAITNQIAWWRVSFLCAQGGFDRIDARPVDFDYTVNHQGVAELANLFKSKWPQPLAVIYPDVVAGDARTLAQDPRQMLKLEHKLRRIKMVLAMLRKTEGDLGSLIHDGYPLDLRRPAYSAA